MTAADALRAKGKKVGVARIRLWRPFPEAELYEAVKGAKNLVVLDRAMNFSGGDTGILGGEVKSVLFDQNHHPNFRSFFVGLGGRDITLQNFEEMVEKASTNGGKPVPYEIINVRD
jgi:pyruvate ferredoxin oxidoreductase alpha subunit